MMRLQDSLIDVGATTQDTREEMFNLMNRYYDNLSKDIFLKDLDEKDKVILLNNDQGDLKGFSTLMTLETFVEDQKINAVFSGDTIIDKEYWGQTGLVKQWFRYALDVDDSSPSSTYWLLVSKGYKTYRFLPTYFNEFYPRHDKDTPEFEKKVLDSFATKKYPENYDPVKGLVIFDGTADRLKEGVADITETKLRNPSIAFFNKINPNHLRGDELACIAKISRENFRSSAKKFIK